MAFRFIIHELANVNDSPQKAVPYQTTEWYQEPASMTAPTLMGHLRSIFPEMAISIQRENVPDAKSPDQAMEDFKKLKDG